MNIRDALTVDDADWKDKVFARAADFAVKACRGLSESAQAPVSACALRFGDCEKFVGTANFPCATARNVETRR
jgi:hypothetical protein